MNELSFNNFRELKTYLDAGGHQSDTEDIILRDMIRVGEELNIYISDSIH